MIAIIDYGIGNLASLHNIIAHVGGTAAITRDLAVIQAARGLIMPGVGSFDACMAALRGSGLLPTIEARVLQDKTPLLGVCVGMQMLGRGSAEGSAAGLGWIAATAQKFSPAAGVRVPHMGWNYVQAQQPHPLFAGMTAPRFYFAHSYHVVCDDPTTVLATGNYGGVFTAAVVRENITGVQFHPEKSHVFGMQLFENFLRISGDQVSPAGAA
jgi:glutamine amidotransferase